MQLQQAVEFTVADDGNVQKVSMMDDTIKVQFNKTASDTKSSLVVLSTRCMTARAERFMNLQPARMMNSLKEFLRLEKHIPLRK